MKKKNQFLQTPFKLGNIELPSNVWCSPLAGWSDLPFRKMTAKSNPGLIFCEMVKMDALVRHDVNTYHILDFEKDTHPIGAQIVGSKPKLAGQAAKIIEDLGFDVVDLNCGCPVDKVTRGGGGSGLLKQPELIAEILCEMVAAVNIPVTVKIRAGWDEGLINSVLITELAEKAGAKAISVHGRTRKQAYKGPANWDYIRACVEAANDIKVIGNGDVFDGPAAERMFIETGCDGVLVSRGTIGNPFLPEDIYRHLNGLEPLERSFQDRCDVLLEHFHHCLEYQSEYKAVLAMRRLGIWYFKTAGVMKDFRRSISKVNTREEAYQILKDHFDVEIPSAV
ncbi:Probable tRNA-dihydrouridine synthase [Chlamydiales bacterium SCGC AG-110-M15]|nr:Probable tRNA-dihydrouridine synthase [Chlamydiales bacterium SCGC AG-110-M15]